MTPTPAQINEAFALLEYAFDLRMFGEDDTATWPVFDQRTEALLRELQAW